VSNSGIPALPGAKRCENGVISWQKGEIQAWFHVGFGNHRSPPVCFSGTDFTVLGISGMCTVSASGRREYQC